jgi:hypothetical protein
VARDVVLVKRARADPVADVLLSIVIASHGERVLGRRDQFSDCLVCWACTWRKTVALNNAIVASGKANMKRLK